MDESVIFAPHSTFLFAMPKAIAGAGRLFDFMNAMTEYNQAASPAEADQLALAMDWLSTGEDLRAGINEVVPDEVRAMALREVAAGA